MKLQLILIPTEDASILALGKNGLLIHTYYPVNAIRNKNDDFQNQHPYLVSDAPIKNNDYVECLGKIYKVIVAEKEVLYFNNVATKAYRKDCKKIEFTTDPKLIADGVPAIDGNTKVWIPNFHPDGSPAGLSKVNFLTEFCKRWNDKVDMVIDYNNNTLTFMENKPTNQSAQEVDVVGAIIDYIEKECTKWEHSVSRSRASVLNVLTQLKSFVLIKEIKSNTPLQTKGREVEFAEWIRNNKDIRQNVSNVWIYPADNASNQVSTEHLFQLFLTTNPLNK